MKRKFISLITFLAFTLSLGSCARTSDDNLETNTTEEESSTTSSSTLEEEPCECSIDDILVFNDDYSKSQLEGERVIVKGVTVSGTHGNHLTIYYDNESGKGIYSALEVVQKEKNNDVYMRQLVDVVGTVKTTNGRVEIVDAIVTLVDASIQNVSYYPSLATSFGAFSLLDSSYSGLLVGGDLYLEVVSYNGATEYKSGEDLIISVAYSSSDSSNPDNLIDLILWGDNDKETIAYYNAFFFGTEEEISWTLPLEDGRVSLPAGYLGIQEGEYITGIIRLFYDNKMCFALDDISVFFINQYAPSTLLRELIEALSEGEPYNLELYYYHYEGQELSLLELIALYLNSSSYNEYMSNLDVIVKHIDMVFNQDYVEIFYYDEDGSISLVVGYYNDDGSLLKCYWSSYESYLLGIDSGQSMFIANDSWSNYFYSFYEMDIYSKSFIKGDVGYAPKDGHYYYAEEYTTTSEVAAEALFNAYFGNVFLNVDIPPLDYILLIPYIDASLQVEYLSSGWSYNEENNTYFYDRDYFLGILYYKDGLIW